MDHPLTVTKKPGPVWAGSRQAGGIVTQTANRVSPSGLVSAVADPDRGRRQSRAACGRRELLQAIHGFALSERSIEPGERPNSYFFSTFHITITGDATMPERVARYAVGIANCPTEIIGRL